MCVCLYMCSRTHGWSCPRFFFMYFCFCFERILSLSHDSRTHTHALENAHVHSLARTKFLLMCFDVTRVCTQATALQNIRRQRQTRNIERFKRMQTSAHTADATSHANQAALQRSSRSAAVVSPLPRHHRELAHVTCPGARLRVRHLSFHLERSDGLNLSSLYTQTQTSVVCRTALDSVGEHSASLT
jgi:hypothetical protein